MKAEASRNLELVSNNGLSGRGDALQVMVERGHAYVGHRISRGISVADVRGPRHPQPVNVLPVHERSWSIHLQTHDGLPLAVEKFDFKSVKSQQGYDATSIPDVHGNQFGTRGLVYLMKYGIGPTILE